MRQEDHETSLADAIRPRPAEDARSGCGSKLWPRWRRGDTWWRRGWWGTTKKPERLKKSLSSLLSRRHTLWPLSLHPSVCAGPERLLGDTLPLPPSIHLRLFHPTPMYTSTLFTPPHSQSPILFASAAKGNLSVSLHHCSPSPAVPVGPVILVPAPAAVGCPLFLIQPSSHPTPRSRTLSCGCSGERRKTLPHE